ncbi:uncharacterized protein [Clytia hemisphaerica]|uniref:uncharacterized protein n=1 Tax=Clytia hemisphaerica TaxID=252671 RepID=UPI0034D6A188
MNSRLAGGRPCNCTSYRCNGAIRSSKTIYRHAKTDASYAIQKTTAPLETQNIDCPYYPGLFETHPAAKTPLFLDADISVLDHIFLEFRKFVSHPSYAKATVSESFRNDKLFKLPKPNESCSSYEEAKAKIKDFLIPIQTFKACEKDCVVFRNELSSAKTCPKCGSSKTKSKTFKYFPIGPRIARLYQNENLVRILQAHTTRPKDGYLRDIWDTSRWENWFDEDGEFKGDDDGVVLNFCSDGVNPFKTMHHVYSMWPLMLSILNFPPALRKSVGGIMLVGIIPGNGRKEAFHVDPYFEILVDELMVLSDCQTFHPGYMEAPVRIKVRLLQYVLDFPAISKVLQQPAAGGLKACPWCKLEGCYCHALNKTVYINIRRNLDPTHCLRKSKSFSKVEKEEKPGSKKVVGCLRKAVGCQ